MIKPSRLLLGWLAGLFGLTLLLGSLKALRVELPVFVDATAWGLLLAMALLLALDAELARRLPRPLLQRQLSPSLALGRWGEVQLQVSHGGRRPLSLDIIDHVPAGLVCQGLRQRLQLGAGESASLSYRLRPLRRGLLDFSRCEVLLHGPLGLCSRRHYLVLPGSIRVYPDFARLFNGQLLAVDNWLSQLGVRQRQRRGLGLEFNQLREFREGDSLRQIDWKATARQRTPIAREYQDERDQQIILLLDCGRRMRSHDGELAHLDHALDACLLLAYVALRQGDAVGLMSFASDSPRQVPPRKGQHQLSRLLNSVYDLDSSQQAADFNEAATRLLATQKRRALVVIVSNLRDEDDEELLNAVSRMGRQHRVLVASLREQVLDDLRLAPVQNWEQALAYCGTVEYLGARQALHDRLAALGVPLIDVRPAELGAELITRYLSLKKAGTL